MLASIRTVDRVIEIVGDAPSVDAGRVIEDVTAVLPAIEAALITVIGDGGVSISPDHQTITVIPPSAAWQQQHTATLAKRALVAQHIAALAPLYTTITASPTQIQNDLTALATIAVALQAGTQPTAAQQVIIDRVLVRLMIVLNS